MSRLTNGLPLKCVHCNHLLVARGREMRQIVCDNQADARYCLLLPSQSFVPISQLCLSVIAIWKELCGDQAKGVVRHSACPALNKRAVFGQSRHAVPLRKSKGFKKKIGGKENKESRREIGKEGRKETIVLLNLFPVSVLEEGKNHVPFQLVFQGNKFLVIVPTNTFT